MRVVITGGNGYGKTSLIEELKKRGFKTKDEVARRLIEEAGRPIHKEDRIGFQKKILDEKIKQFKEAEGLVFFDDGIPSSTGYILFSNMQPPKEFLEANQRYRYDAVFFLEKLPVHENDGIRENEDESARLHGIFKKVYQDLGYSIIALPPVGIKERADLVLKHLKIAEKGKS